MQSIAKCPDNTFRQIKAVLCDIDDTLSWKGKLPAVAYMALENLQAAGLIVVPITGRPAGWCDHIARMWPVNGVVGENGAFYFYYDETSRKMVRKYWRDDIQLQKDRCRLQRIAERVLAEIPGAAISADQGYRESDLAIDFCEDVEPLSQVEIEHIVDIFESEGATAKISSIHVNGWFGNYDKLLMARKILEEVFKLSVDSNIASICFVGDSPNDVPMFEYFSNTVGVSNVIDFVDSMEARPRWVTENPGGAGFAELAETLLKARER